MYFLLDYCRCCSERCAPLRPVNICVGVACVVDVCVFKLFENKSQYRVNGSVLAVYVRQPHDTVKRSVKHTVHISLPVCAYLLLFCFVGA